MGNGRGKQRRKGRVSRDCDVCEGGLVGLGEVISIDRRYTTVHTMGKRDANCG
jgi:hypothetical protein